MSIKITKLSPNNIAEFEQLINIFKTVFELSKDEITNRPHLEYLLNKEDFFVIVAQQGTQVIGGLSVYVLHRYFSDNPIAYVYDVGVLPEHQRKGIGNKLMSFLTNYCKINGFEDVFVEAEADDSQAVNFYKTTQYTSVLQATQFTYATLKKHKN